jgi:hypothetical protein
MAATLSPVKIIRLWRKVNDRYGPKEPEKGEKPKGKAAAEVKQNEKIERGMKALKAVAQAGVKTPGQVKKFESTRTKLNRLLLLYCKTLKSAKPDGYQDLNKFRKNVRQLTVTVGHLSAVNADLADEGAVDLGDLLGIDDSGLDKALTDPSLDQADDVAFDEAEEPPAPEAPPVPPEPGAPDSDLAAQWAQRREALEPKLLQALKGQGGDAGKLRAVFQFALGKAETGQYAAALQGLNQLEKLLEKTGAEAEALVSQTDAPVSPEADGSPAAPSDLEAALKSWQNARILVVNQLRRLEAAVQKGNHPDAVWAIVRLESICKQLTARPDTLPKVAAVEAYLKGDEIIDVAEEPNQFGIPVKIREPLLRELVSLKPHLSAQ